MSFLLIPTWLQEWEVENMAEPKVICSICKMMGNNPKPLTSKEAGDHAIKTGHNTWEWDGKYKQKVRNGEFKILV